MKRRNYISFDVSLKVNYNALLWWLSDNIYYPTISEIFAAVLTPDQQKTDAYVIYLILFLSKRLFYYILILSKKCILHTT